MAGANFSLMDLVETLIHRRQAQNMRGHAGEAADMTRRRVTGQDKTKPRARQSPSSNNTGGANRSRGRTSSGALTEEERARRAAFAARTRSQ